MSGYLLDTDVLSALAPGRPPPAPAVAEWLEEHSDALFLSVISVVEIEAGVKKLYRLGSKARADLLAAWIERILSTYSERVLGFDLAAGKIAGAIADRARATGSYPGFADVAIAATAERHGSLLLTANTRHFAPIGIRYANPFETLPP